MKKLHHIYIALILLAAACVLDSCVDDLHERDFQHEISNWNDASAMDRVVSEETRKVLLLYSAGFNSLSSYLQQDIDDLKKGYIPPLHRNQDVLLVYSHFPSKSNAYAVNNPPVLTRLYRTMEGRVEADTLVVYDEASVSASAAHMNEVLTYIRDEFPAKSYGMIFSSHATGYLPSGYYSAADQYENGNIARTNLMSSPVGLVPVPYVAPEYDEADPPVKSIGQTLISVNNNKMSYEMDIKDFAAAIPMRMDYILFDACLMGGVEVAYELKDVCNRVAFSQTEVLAEGLNYSTLAEHLINVEDSMPVEVCRDYFTQYDSQSGVMRSATISLVDCRKLDRLVAVCSDLFSTYRSSINTLNHSKVQRYYRSSYHWFYDLESILVQAGANQQELADLRQALDECVVYKASTPSFMNSFSINVFSGFSMFLPSHGGNYLKSYYRTLGWNNATGLVQ